MEKKVAAETKKAENIIKAKITREEAILAKQREIDQKHAETEELKEEKAQLMRRKERLSDWFLRQIAMDHTVWIVSYDSILMNHGPSFIA